MVSDAYGEVRRAKGPAGTRVRCGRHHRRGGGGKGQARRRALWSHGLIIEFRIIIKRINGLSTHLFPIFYPCARYPRIVKVLVVVRGGDDGAEHNTELPYWVSSIVSAARRRLLNNERAWPPDIYLFC